MTTLLNPQALAQLTAEFRLSMSRLLQDLCRELRTDYRDVSSRLNLPVGLFEQLGRSLDLARFSTWKVVGWIETLNDLVYFLDLLQQWEVEPDRKEFMRQLFAECQDKFFENSYLSDLFPSGVPTVSGFEKRLSSLCGRLAREVTQEALFFDPVRATKWVGRQTLSGWSMVGSLDANFERADPPAAIPVGLDDEWCEAPDPVRRVLRRSPGRSVFFVEAEKIALRLGRATVPIWSREKGKERWLWRRRAESKVADTTHGPVTIGPTLVYGSDRSPRKVQPTDLKQVKRIRRAWYTIRAAWPDGHAVLELLTSRIVPLKAKGVVSFSYRHRPGLSFINCFDRDNLDLIDDLIHENSHHHLNLLLRKSVMYRGDRNQRIFYSPWRRSLRPLRGILHAAFTFTMGAMLFERLSSWASGREGSKQWKRAGLTRRDLQRARFRGLEEIESVRYSLQDLRYADRRFGWLTGSGRRLVRQMEEAIAEVEDRLVLYRGDVLRSTFGPALRRHVEQLKKARATYGPMRLSEV
ncbi:MAG: HEXXH motif-containing putative peptide modification protein [Nitrospira sp.]|nr:HEXXH motif-containing putative peptide modification protein [Nitrospira sp.]MCP9461502.1 HEXXH motif-containing putative peptide modification protein [Nitrospira sp.]MCP9473984.1 HEXXH motif-containing putative peptide modification protein [Nitrospira sp.]